MAQGSMIHWYQGGPPSIRLQRKEEDGPRIPTVPIILLLELTLVVCLILFISILGEMKCILFHLIQC